MARTGHSHGNYRWTGVCTRRLTVENLYLLPRFLCRTSYEPNYWHDSAQLASSMTNSIGKLSSSKNSNVRNDVDSNTTIPSSWPTRRTTFHNFLWRSLQHSIVRKPSRSSRQLSVEPCHWEQFYIDVKEVQESSNTPATSGGAQRKIYNRTDNLCHPGVVTETADDQQCIVVYDDVEVKTLTVSNI